ncbi:hypothetical protein T459_21566 [Capsicum annuum]|uniref:Uncharacterized protein n=1 Tax=Capsicum annuum TaxID=4072 RepID=A0A2G2YX29_CAPAN|nr:hypothetical protein T459_21566 [Capsicum annuum]
MSNCTSKSDKYANATTRCKIGLSRTSLEAVDSILGASACEMTSPFTESISEQWDDFGHKLLFKENEQEVDGVVVLTPTHSNNKVEAKSDQKSCTNIKSWVDMAEEEKQASSPLMCRFQAKRYESGDLVEDPMEAFEGDLGIDIFDEEDEDKVLDECFAKVARDGDLSPRQQRKGFKKKKTHERKHSWDGKVFEEVILRQLPMRVAKQKETRFSYIKIQ